MARKEDSQAPITVEILGEMLNKYISPLYTRMDKFEVRLDGIEKDQREMKRDLEQVKKDVTLIKHRVDNTIEALHDRAELVGKSC